MTKRINWRKGMRLTDDLLRKSDECTQAVVDKCFALAAAGGFGLLPSTGAGRFDISLGVNRDYVEIYTLRCLGITQGGHLIDIDRDGSSPLKIVIPDNSTVQHLLLMAQLTSAPWVETDGDLEEPRIAYQLISEDIPLSFDRALPIARLLREGEDWCQDNEFMPPLLYLSAHPQMEALCEQFIFLLQTTDEEAGKQVNSDGRVAISVFWPIVQQLRITMDKEKDRMSPAQLLGNVQKFVSAFVCGAEIDENLSLMNADVYRNYIYLPYSYANSCATIKEGLQLCYEIVTKVQGFQDKPQPKSVPVSIPYISNPLVVCRNPKAIIPIDNVDDGATVFFTTNGRSPSSASERAKRDKKGRVFIEFPNDFQNKVGEEPDKHVTIILMATKNGQNSEEGVFEITLRKEFKVVGGSGWKGITINK